MTKLLILLTALSTLWVNQGYAHPVAFKGSKGIMGYHSPFLTHVQVNYSYRHWLAIGAHNFTRPDQDSNRATNVVSANLLLKRWNGEALQANLYANLGVGHSDMAPEPSTVGYGLLQFDIEDRDYYFLAKHLQLVSEDVTDLRQSTVRAGISPYVGDYKDIHSWFILEYQSTEILQTQQLDDFTPFLRVFYKNLLFEIGQSFRGFSRFNYTMHF